MTEKVSDKRMNDMGDSNGIIHLNENKKMNNASKKLLNQQVVEMPIPPQRQLVPWAQMNTIKEHF